MSHWGMEDRPFTAAATLGNAVGLKGYSRDKEVQSMEDDKPKKAIKRPVCPNCEKEMERVAYKGYYDEFDYWDCECENIPADRRWNGGYC